MNMLFKGKIALITGASTGIGSATAILLARLGADVIINYNQSENDAIIVGDIIRKLGQKVYIEQADVSQQDSVERMFKRINEYTEKLDILVNNAGINSKNYIRYMTEKQWDEVLNTNLKGAFLCTKCALKIMMTKRTGVIVNVSSSVVYKTNLCQANYVASKAGLIALTKSTAKEVGKLGIRVNAVAPGPVYTKLNDLTSQKEQEAIELIPLSRIGTPEDIAKIIAFLASDYASYITGQVLVADGGLTL